MIPGVTASGGSGKDTAIIGYVGANTGTYNTPASFATLQWNYNSSGSNGQSLAVGTNIDVTIYAGVAFTGIYLVVGTPGGGNSHTINDISGPHNLVAGKNVITTTLDVTATGQHLGIATSVADAGKAMGQITALNSNVAYTYLTGISPNVFPPLVGSTYSGSGNAVTGALIAEAGYV